MGNDKLQALSRQYARGEIAKPEYRQKRAKIIDDATGVNQQDAAVTVEPAQAQAFSQRPVEPSLYFKAGIISAVVIVALIVVFSIM